MPSLRGIHETVLYGRDTPALAAFYSGVLGLRLVGVMDAHSAAMRLPEGDAVLLLFDFEYAATPGRGVPTHGTTGPSHVAFRVVAGTLDQWRESITASGVTIELERGWSRGGRSIYFRDPADNSVELIDGEVWAE